MATMTAGHGGPSAAHMPGRRRTGSRILIALPVSLTLLATACGAGSGAASRGSGSSSSVSAASTPVAAPSASAASPAGTTYPLTITDDAHRTVTIAAKPKRIVSLTLGTDEILFSLVSPSRIVGVSSDASDPTMSFVASQVSARPGLARLTANAEAVIALKPDLVFAADYTKAGVIQQLTAAGIPVVEFTTFSSIADVEAHVRTMAEITGDPAAGAQIVSDMNQEVATVQKAVAGLNHPRVIYYSGGYLYGAGTTADEVIRDAGGDDAAADAGFKNWTQVGTEELVKLNPDIILTDASGSKDVDQGTAVQKLLNDPALRDVPAVKNRQVWGLSVRAGSDVGQYMAWDVQDFASILHPAHVHLYQP